MQTAFSTPMMKQYLGIKKQNPDCLLFFRVGDFYELYMEDAFVGAQVLNITLTHKRGGKDGDIPMAGVPYHAVDPYLTKLVKAGHKVAICEQVSLPNKYGIVDREVVRVVTPGTVLDEKALEKKENNYIMSLFIRDEVIALAVADISTGYFATTEYAFTDLSQTLKDELARLHPSECILPEDLYNDPILLKILKSESGLNIYSFPKWDTFSDKPKRFLQKHFGVATLASFGIEEKDLALQSAAALLGYLQETQKQTVQHIKKILPLGESDCLLLDRSTMINLELFSTIRQHDTKGTLLDVLDSTITAMGGRLLKSWMRKPLGEKEAIEQRLDAVDFFVKHSDIRDALREELKRIPDIERLLSRLSVNLGNARDLVNLKSALRAILYTREFISTRHPEQTEGKPRNKPVIPDLIGNPVHKQKQKDPHFHEDDIMLPLLKQTAQQISPKLEKLIEYIDEMIVQEPPITIREGRMIQEGVSSELDKLRKTIGKSKEWILELEKSEREKTGINSLKVKFNKVFGFYIEITKTNVHLVPEYFMRKQTLVNGERYITPELKEHEEIILTAEEKINDLEYTLFLEVLEHVLKQTEHIQNAAQSIAVFDVITSFAYLSEKSRYVRPKLLYSGEIRIKQGRHPVVEKLLEDSQFVPNDVTLDNISQQLLLITGPNMAGKSVFIRQVALLVLMAQMGCFVPAQSAYISICDRIFVRSGASDVITSGLSTFMVEMVETAHILHHATKNSLIIMDEIGRGTSTYDGISIAWAVAEYLVTSIKPSPKTLFATHYHELQALEDQYEKQIKNFHMAVTEEKCEPIFLHTILPGGASHSFGVAVAKLAGVPQPVIEKATELLHTLENRNIEDNSSVISRSEATRDLGEISHFVRNDNIENHLIHKELETLDIGNMTPLEALNKLAELKDKLKLLSQTQKEKFLEAD